MSVQLENQYAQLQKEFLICDNCFWTSSAVSFRLTDISKCPQCDSNLSRIPIASNEKFTLLIDSKHGVELVFE
jgi:hypothetical protein